MRWRCLSRSERGVHAQTTLRIGLAEDPDILDPTLARTYVGRIVFASFCDKLFDIDEKLNIVPQLALSHETSADGKEVTIKLRPGVKFHDGEPFDAEAAKFSLERHLTMPGSFRKPELAALDHVEVVDPLTIKLVLKTPFSPLIAQLTDRAGMMVSPKAAKDAGDKFGLHPVCAGPYKFVERVQQDRIVFEKFADYWNKDNVFIDRIVYLPIVDVDGAARQPEVRRPRPDRARAGHRHQGGAAPTRNSSCRARSTLGYQGVTLNIGKDKAKGPLSQSAKVRQALDLSIDREAINQVVFNGEFKPGNQWVNPEHPYYQKAFPVRARDVAKAKALLKEAGVTTPVSVDFMVPKGAETEAVAAGDPVDGGRGRLRHEDQGHRIRDLAEAGGGRRIPGLYARLERPDRSRRQFLHLPAQQRAAELQRAVPMPRSTRRSTTRASSPTWRSARRSMKN